MALGIACQNAAYLAAICDLELRFRATTGGRVAIREIAQLNAAILRLRLDNCGCFVVRSTLEYLGGGKLKLTFGYAFMNLIDPS